MSRSWRRIPAAGPKLGPGPVLTAHGSFIRGSERSSDTRVVRRVEIAMQADPVTTGRGQPLLNRTVTVKIVMSDHRGRSVDQSGVRGGAREHLFRRTDEPERPTFNNGLVHGQRARNADGLNRALDRQTGVVDGVVAGLGQDGAGPGLAVGG